MPKSKQLIPLIVKHILSCLPIFIVVLLGTPIIGMAYIETTKVLGLRPIPVTVIGTGSMYPSLFWDNSEGGPEDENHQLVAEYRTTPKLYRFYSGLNLLGHTFFRRTPDHGDIVSFKNDKTAKILKSEEKDVTSGFIKRIIGTPGDKIELRDGFVYRSGELIEEPYIVSPRSTYGGTWLKDCSSITVPVGSYFVLGDNRKVSSDSRFELEFIKDTDIEFVLPYAEQEIYRSLWRDTSKDSQLLGQPTLITPEFLSLVNSARNEKGLKNLSLKSSLVKSSAVRGEKLLLDDKTSYSMQDSMTSAGYANIVLGEFVSYGHFTAKELIENLLFNPSTAKQILNSDYSDIGISDVSREVDGCPARIIVGHLGGYLPADYDASTISSWQGLRDNLREVIPSWEKAVGYDNVDQTKLASLLTILRRRLTLAEEIVSSMEKREWLSDSQLERIKNDKNDGDSAELLSKELNQE